MVRGGSYVSSVRPLDPPGEPGYGTLYLVATPIGNDGDLSPRARTVLGSVDTIAAEDTRVTAALLRRLGLRAPALVSYHDHNERQRSARLVEGLVAGRSVALVSDAGTPLISDPGYRLVVAAVARGIDVVVVPGPCAAVAALSASGLPPNRFVVLGFLPRDRGPRNAVLAAYRHEVATVVIHSAPHRVLRVLADVLAEWGDRPMALARNLTKPDARWIRGSVRSVIAALEGAEGVRGELTLVIGGAEARPTGDDPQLVALIAGLAEAGVSPAVVRDVVAKVYDRPRRWVYQQALAALEDPDP